MIRQIGSAVALAWFIVAPVPALAFEPLATFLALAPGDLSIPHEVFSYSSPDTPFRESAQNGTTVWPGDQALGMAMMDPNAVRAITGIDFAAAKGIFISGAPPSQVTILTGADGFAADAGAVLVARGFDGSTVSGFPVFANGEDFALDRDDLASGDPFQYHMGRAYRLAVTADYVVRAFSWPDMNTTLAALASPEACGGCLPWRALLTAVENVSGAGATLEAATGFTMTAFMGPADPMVLLDPDLTPEAREKLAGEMTSPTLALPPFGYALFALTRAEGIGAAHISLLFPTLEMAETGGDAVVERLKAQMAAFERSGNLPTHAEIATAAAKASLGATATISVQFGPGAPDGGVKHYLRWFAMIYRREFYALSVLQ